MGRRNLRMPMKSLVILGANSQVGAEVALYLSKLCNVNLHCIVRSDFSSVLFRKLNIPFSIVANDDLHGLQDVFEHCNTVVDFRYPAANVRNIDYTLEPNIQMALAAMRPGSHYIYISSIMAHGIPADSDIFRSYKVP